MTGHPSLRHFHKGISLVSQWTGEEYKELKKVFLGVIAGAADGAIVSAVRAVMDFIYYVHLEHHTDSTLKKLKATWVDFHKKKSVFVTHSIRKDFNIPKLHSIQHYLHMIKSHGTTDNFNTKLPECLHIIIAKDAFDHTNKRDYIAQMCLQLQRHEAVCKFTAYLVWSVEDYVPGGKKKHQVRNVNTVDPGGEDPPTLDDETDDSPINIGLPKANPAPLLHHTAKKPPLTMSLTTINSKFGINRVAETLERFLKAAGSLHPSLHHAINNTDYSIFKQFTIKIPSPPQVTSDPFMCNVISAKVGKPGHTVLAKPDLSFDDNTPIKWWDARGEFQMRLCHLSCQKQYSFNITELCVTLVLLIFNLLTELADYPLPLAYVQWFQRFSVKDQTIGMYKVSTSTYGGGYANTSIVPIMHIC